MGKWRVGGWVVVVVVGSLFGAGGRGDDVAAWRRGGVAAWRRGGVAAWRRGGGAAAQRAWRAWRALARSTTWM
jgi:hypothetical protein